MTEWKPIPETAGVYEISSTGLVRKRVGEKTALLAAHADRKGYFRVRFTVNGVRKTKKVHRLVALAFLPNPEDKPEVNHKDGNKQNNCADNLEWVTPSENSLHAYQNGLKENTRAWCRLMGNTLGRDQLRKSREARSTPIEATRKCDGAVFRYPSQGEAARSTGTPQANIYKVLKGYRKTANGYSFRYLGVVPE